MNEHVGGVGVTLSLYLSKSRGALSFVSRTNGKRPRQQTKRPSRQLSLPNTSVPRQEARDM
jgi:hypothetical protein